jgi:hypothetical protein
MDVAEQNEPRVVRLDSAGYTVWYRRFICIRAAAMSWFGAPGSISLVPIGAAPLTL